jgi:ABC-type dipeptide/oligopeptide/nickel transport system permease subunit
MSWIHGLVDVRKRIFFLLGIGLLLIGIAYTLPSPTMQNLDVRFSPVALPYSLGTDQLGRELSSRLYFGFINSAKLVTLTMFATLAISIPAGLLAARSRWAESILNIIAGAIWSIPTFIIALIVFIGFKGEWIEVKFALLGVFNWVPIFRSVRDVTKQVQEASYVMFAKAIGMTTWEVYSYEIFPNMISGVYPIILLNVVSLFEVDFILSFLGLSYSDPTPTLGGILRQGIEYLNMNMILFPSVLLSIIIQIIIILSNR